MKKLLCLMALAAGVLGAAEYRIEGNNMNYDEDWQKGVGGGTGGSILYAPKKGLKATGTYAIPTAGKYVVWVHGETRNEGWRKAQIKINGIPFGKFGDDKIKGFTKPTFYWKKLMLPLEVKTDGEVIKVEVVSLSGSARFDSIVLSSTPDFTPVGKTDAEVEEAAEELESGE
ncbi:MAG: hypothetical protein MJ033_07150 [Victivallaceae bacterium]|nr:hypothetical protein [Victivallaceae bacterium]